MNSPASLGVFGAVFQGALLLGLASKLASPARTVGQLGELFQIVAAINDAGVEEGNLFRHAWRLE